MNLPKPRSKISKVLYRLITEDLVTEQQFRINSFRSILSDLRNDYGIPIRSAWVEEIDEFKRPVTYKQHYLLPSSKARAAKKYLKIAQA